VGEIKREPNKVFVERYDGKVQKEPVVVDNGEGDDGTRSRDVVLYCCVLCCGVLCCGVCCETWEGMKQAMLAVKTGVFIGQCKGPDIVVQIKGAGDFKNILERRSFLGKCKNITVSNCENIAVVFDTCVTTVEVVYSFFSLFLFVSSPLYLLDMDLCFVSA